MASTPLRLPIRRKLILFTAIPLTVIYVVVVGLILLRLRDRALEDTRLRSVHQAEQYAARLDGIFRAVAQAASSTAGFLAVRSDLSEEQIYALAERNVIQDDLIYGSCIAYAPFAWNSGQRLFAPYVCRDGPGLRRLDIGAAAYDYTQPEWAWYVRPAESGLATWTEPYFDEGAGDILMSTFSAPAHRNGELVAVATIDIPLHDLQQRVGLDDLRNPFVILSASGHFVSAPDAALVMRETIESQAERLERPDLALVARRMLAGESGMARMAGMTGREPVWFVYAPIPSAGWSLAISMPEREVLAFMRQQLLGAALGLLVALVLTIACLWYVAGRITQPIERLHQAAARVGAGNLDVPPVQVGTHDEVGDLAGAFNRMVSDLRQHIDALTRETAARESVESELRVARRIQTSLLPTTFPAFPNRPEFDLHAVNAAARRVAGDFYDFFMVNERRLVMTIADVSGKGVPAALLMAVTRTLVRNIAPTVPPGEALTQINKILQRDNVGHMFVTLFLLVCDPLSGDVSFANAGHPPPLLIPRSGPVQRFGDVTGPLLGVMDDEIATDQGRLEPGESLVLFTDGVTEATAPGGALYSEARLVALLEQHRDLTPPHLCQQIVDTIDAYQHGGRSDDVTVLVFRRNEPPLA